MVRFLKTLTCTSQETTQATVNLALRIVYFRSPLQYPNKPRPQQRRQRHRPFSSACGRHAEGCSRARVSFSRFYSKKHFTKRTTHHKTQLPPCFCQCACLCRDNCITKTSVIEYLTFLFSCGLRSTESNQNTLEQKKKQQQVSGK